MLLFYHFTCLCLKLNIFCEKVALNLEFSQQQFYISFYIKKYLTILVSNRNKSDDKKVTESYNIHNPAYVFWTCPDM